ncbi:MAG TPA: outer membrane protein transport protein [Rhodocyclaceae bacterium]|nr:outer membrane protein transport protein [Rhodocyclaceae bacterium]
MKRQKLVVLIAATGFVAPALATNGMNMAGYGPVAESMGGVSMAYDNGDAGMINNPATLGFMQSGTSRLDVALGDLMPDATSNGATSSAKDFYMPAMGYVRKDGKLSWGVGMMAQGGMGTEFSNSAAFGQLLGANFVTQGGYPIADPSLKNKSEVGVGRLMFPLSYNISPNLNVGGSIDYVWAGMDLQWVMDGAHFADLMPGAPNRFGSVSQTSSILQPFMGAMGQGAFTSVDYAYFNFDTSSKFTQKATADGWAGNLGFTYKASEQLTIGGVYHAKTHLSDMKTGGSDATMTIAVRGGTMGAQAIPVVGQAVIKNFQWPETWGLGLAYKVNDSWNVMADYKRINWADVMRNFNLSFIASGAASNGNFANSQLNVSYTQNWDNQNVYMLGAAYKYNDAMTLRFGTNVANNPIPDGYVSPLFPAIMKTHYTFGLGYAFSKASSFDGSIVYSPKVTVTNNAGAVAPGFANNQTISLGGASWQMMYSHRF